MSESDCQVVFYGELAPGQESAVVRKKVAALFKASESQIAAFFSGNRVVVKSGLPAQKAEQYRMALAKAGAVAHIEGPGFPKKAPGAAQSRPPAQPRSPVASQTVSSQSAASTSAPARAAPKPAITASTPSATKGEAGVEPGDDVGRAVVSQVDGEKLGQLQAATIAPTGTTLGDAKEQPEVNMDLSHMSLSAVGSDLQDSYDETPPSTIDTSHLSLDQ